MCIKLNYTCKILKYNFLPNRIKGKIISYLKNKYENEKYLEKYDLNGNEICFGGVFGLTENSLTENYLENEDDLIQFLKKYFRNKNINTIIDVGANTGQSLLLFKSFNNKTRVDCFEPFPELTELLEILVKINNFNDVYINNIILSNSNGIGELYYSEKSTETASTVKNFQNTFNSKIEVQKTSLDSYVSINKLQKLDLIKIDVEGGELEVVEGANECISRFKPDIILELLYTKHDLHLERQLKLIKILKEYGYKFYLIKEKNNLMLQDLVEPDENYKYLNYYLTI